MSDKSTYQVQLEARLDRLRAEIRGLEAKARSAGGETRERCEQDLKVLRARQTGARVKLADLCKEQGRTWQELRASIAAAPGGLGSAL
ncbi:hypothetical protein [Oceanibium sediminis]|uniref:hypothetical protein n=1 Tax=Oceanibium sediminis TaxID=2026339 RepID=UPI000DD461AA|nr:hypothetical protein [Oceanibium sediminis]